MILLLYVTRFGVARLRVSLSEIFYYFNLLQFFNSLMLCIPINMIHFITKNLQNKMKYPTLVFYLLIGDQIIGKSTDKLLACIVFHYIYHIRNIPFVLYVTV